MPANVARAPACLQTLHAHQHGYERCCRAGFCSTSAVHCLSNLRLADAHAQRVALFVVVRVVGGCCGCGGFKGHFRSVSSYSQREITLFDNLRMFILIFNERCNSAKKNCLSLHMYGLVICFCAYSFAQKKNHVVKMSIIEISQISSKYSLKITK